MAQQTPILHGRDTHERTEISSRQAHSEADSEQLLDCALLWSCAPGYVSYRPVSGESLAIKHFCEVVNRWGGCLSLLDMALLVNKSLTDSRPPTQPMQHIWFEHGMTKRCHFFEIDQETYSHTQSLREPLYKEHGLSHYSGKTWMGKFMVPTLTLSTIRSRTKRAREHCGNCFGIKREQER